MMKQNMSEMLVRMRISTYQRRKIVRGVADIEEKYRSELEAIADVIGESLHEVRLASEMKSQFLASMSHELRTPLNSIIGFLEVILSGLGFDEDPILDSNAREYLNIAYENASRLLRLINDLLDLSKIEANRMEVVLSNINVRGLAESLYREYVGLAHQKSIELRCLVDDNMPETVRSDKQKLRSILVNLIGNGIKFTKEGYVQVFFSRNGEGWKVEVRDTGIGFDMEREEELWSPFIQLESGASRTYGGTGLGMAIAKKMTGLLGGEIAVESIVNKGSLFVVCFPDL